MRQAGAARLVCWMRRQGRAWPYRLQPRLDVVTCCTLQAAALLGQMAWRSQERNDELAAALARAPQSLAAALFDEAPETQYGARPSPWQH